MHDGLRVKAQKHLHNTVFVMTQKADEEPNKPRNAPSSLSVDNIGGHIGLRTWACPVSSDFPTWNQVLKGGVSEAASWENMASEVQRTHQNDVLTEKSVLVWNPVAVEQCDKTLFHP